MVIDTKNNNGYKESLWKIPFYFNLSQIFLSTCQFYSPWFHTFYLKSLNLFIYSYWFQIIYYPWVRNHIIGLLSIYAIDGFYFFILTSLIIILSINSRSFIPLDFVLHLFCSWGNNKFVSKNFFHNYTCY